MEKSKNFLPLGPGELLALTGQIHSEDYKYDKIVAIYVGVKNDLTPDDFENASTTATCVATAGLNLKEKRIVDITVHPYYRRLGFGKMFVNLLVKEFGVEIAYTVSDEADKFWRSIGWVCIGLKTDKDVIVKQWILREAMDADMLSALPEIYQTQFKEKDFVADE